MMTVSEISLAYLISGTISIYTGSAFGEYITDLLGAQKSMLLASSIYASALLHFESVTAKLLYCHCPVCCG